MNKKRYITVLMIIMLFLLGIFIKGYYINKTDTWVRQHDVIGFGAEEGHAAYIEYILNNHKLPDFDPREKWGFFQPPLHHFISAGTMQLSYMLGANEKRAQENTQIPTCIYMVLVTLFSVYMFLKAKGVSKLSHSDARNKLYTVGCVTMLSIIAFHPIFILLSGSINNDALALVLSVLAIVIACEWYNNPSIFMTILLALTIGFAMLAKLTGGLVAVPIAIIMLMRFFGQGSGIGRRIGLFFEKYFIKAVVFVIIVFPLGLSFFIRNKIKWNVPLNYIPPVGENFPGEITLADRLLTFKTNSVYVNLTTMGDSFDEYSIPLAVLKTSLFGEYNYSDISRWMKPLTLVLTVSAVILMCIAFVATFYMTFSKKNKIPVIWKISLTGTYVTYLCAYLYFAITHGNFSAQDFRYAAICIVCEGIYTGLFVDTVKNKRIKHTIEAVSLVFAISAFMTYFLLGYKS